MTRADRLTRFKSTQEAELAEQPVSVVLPKELDEFVRSLPDRSKWLREAVAEKRVRESSSTFDT